MTIQEAYEQLNAALPQDVSITIQTDVWWFDHDGKRGEPDVEFLVSYESGGDLYKARTLDHAVALCLSGISSRAESGNIANAERALAQAAELAPQGRA